jgi:hypothetical protein
MAVTRDGPNDSPESDSETDPDDKRKPKPNSSYSRGGWTALALFLTGLLNYPIARGLYELYGSSFMLGEENLYVGAGALVTVLVPLLALWNIDALTKTTADGNVWLKQLTRHLWFIPFGIGIWFLIYKLFEWIQTLN